MPLLHITSITALQEPNKEGETLIALDKYGVIWAFRTVKDPFYQNLNSDEKKLHHEQALSTDLTGWTPIPIDLLDEAITSRADEVFALKALIDAKKETKA